MGYHSELAIDNPPSWMRNTPAQISADQQHRNRTCQIRDLLEAELYYPMNILAILRELPADDLAAVERFVNRCHDWRTAH